MDWNNYWVEITYGSGIILTIIWVLVESCARAIKKKWRKRSNYGKR